MDNMLTKARREGNRASADQALARAGDWHAWERICRSTGENPFPPCPKTGCNHKAAHWIWRASFWAPTVFDKDMFGDFAFCLGTPSGSDRCVLPSRMSVAFKSDESVNTCTRSPCPCKGPTWGLSESPTKD